MVYILIHFCESVAIGGHGDVVAVRAEVAFVFVQGLDGGDVGRVLHHLVHPLDPAHDLVPLLVRENWRALNI